jgi:hypothetical protein
VAFFIIEEISSQKTSYFTGIISVFIRLINDNIMYNAISI